ncbi:MAG: hypothetical protein WC742_15385 [Gallionellaceae bacterium]|jgi:hypothetical protein
MKKLIGRQEPVKTREMSLEGEYEGWEFSARTNPPISAFGDVASGDFDRIVTGLAKILRGWNFVDENGVELPPPDATVIRERPLDLLTAIANKYVTELSTLSPN